MKKNIMTLIAATLCVTLVAAGCSPKATAQSPPAVTPEATVEPAIEATPSPESIPEVTPEVTPKVMATPEVEPIDYSDDDTTDDDDSGSSNTKVKTSTKTNNNKVTFSKKEIADAKAQVVSWLEQDKIVAASVEPMKDQKVANEIKFTVKFKGEDFAFEITTIRKNNIWMIKDYTHTEQNIAKAKAALTAALKLEDIKADGLILAKEQMCPTVMKFYLGDGEILRSVYLNNTWMIHDVYYTDEEITAAKKVANEYLKQKKITAESVKRVRYHDVYNEMKFVVKIKGKDDMIVVVYRNNEKAHWAYMQEHNENC